VVRDERVDFAAFVAARSPQLLRSAEFLCGGDVHRAEDLLQTALARAHARWSRISADDPEPYGRRILVNLAADWWRSPLSRVRLSGHVEPDRAGVGDPETRVADRELLRHALAPLSSRERVVLVLRFYWDLSEQQTAAELGWPLGSVKSTTARALAKVRRPDPLPAVTPPTPSAKGEKA
jgi:RNA polymerase sigma-70 factor (sigma-E family)